MNQAVSFWRQHIELQLKHNLEGLCAISIKNFHFPGLNYVCFDYVPGQKAVRLYIVEPVSNLDTTNVNIHNHLYDSQILVLKGQITNTTYKLDNDADDYNIYSLTSALHPDNLEKKIKLRHITKRGLKVDTVKVLNPGDTHYQPHTEIHNVANHPTELTAFMVFEFPTVKANSNIFTKKEYVDTIPTPNAYLRYNRTEMKELLENLLEKM
jgi:hypothetical protein